MVKDGVWYPAGTDVPAESPVNAELTDDVPDGALDINEDGSINSYDEDGNVVGAVSAEELAEQDKPKRGRKPKEA